MQNFCTKQGFGEQPIQQNHAKCCGPTLVAMTTKFGLGTEIQLPTGSGPDLAFEKMIGRLYKPNTCAFVAIGR